MVVSCFNINENNYKTTTILLTNLSCQDCQSEINEIIQSMEDIEYYEIWVNNGKTMILINIKYNYKKITIDRINTIIASHGYGVELLNDKK